MNNIPDSRIGALISEVVAKRDAGVVTCEIRPRSEFPRELPGCLDAFVAALALKGLGDNWVEVPRDAAHWIIRRWLSLDLVDHAEMMPLAEAEALAARFMAEFRSEGRFFTNGGLHSAYPGAMPESGGDLRVGTHPFNPRVKSLCAGTWNSLTNATFDTGVVAVDDSQIGLVWFEDED